MENIGNNIRVAVVGLGGMGTRWAEVAQTSDGAALLGVADADGKKAAAISEKFGCKAYAGWQEAVGDAEVDAIIVATPHVFLTQIAQAALAAGKHVFCEKPGGISSVEIQKGVDIAEKKNLRYRVNFNMRLHLAVALAKQKIDSG